MKRGVIATALKNHLRLGNLGPGRAWPNVDHDRAKPYFAVDWAAVERQGLGLTSSSQIERGRLAVVVVTEKGIGEAPANAYADAVAELFAHHTVIDFEGGSIRISGPPSVRGGYADDEGWRVPVMIPYTAVSR